MNNKHTLNKLDKKYKTVRNFLIDHETKNTYRIYRSGLSKFVDIMSINPDTYIQDPRFLERKEKILLIDKYENDMRTFIRLLKKEGKSNNTINTYVCALSTFLEFHHIEIERYRLKKIKKLKKKTVTRYIPLTNEDIAKILIHAPLKHRALFLFLGSSGMRKGETLQLELDDIDFDNHPTKIIIRPEYTKTETGRITFISDEATEELRKWLEIRENYLERANRITNIGSYHGWVTKSKDNNRIFPYSESNATVMWNSLLRKENLFEYDKTTNRVNRPIHSLRKFFRTSFTNDVLAKKLMGQESELDEIYKNKSEAELGKLYLKEMDQLNIIKRPMTTKEATEEIKSLRIGKVEQDNKIKEMEKQLLEILKFKERILPEKRILPDDEDEEPSFIPPDEAIISAYKKEKEIQKVLYSKKKKKKSQQE